MSPLKTNIPTSVIPGNFELSLSTCSTGNEVDAFSVLIKRVTVTLPIVSPMPGTKSAIKFFSVNSALSEFKRLSMESYKSYLDVDNHLERRPLDGTYAFPI